MIENNIIKENKKEFQIEEYIGTTLKNVGLSKVKLQKTPLGDKIIVYTSRPGLVVGRKGENITKLNRDLKEKFNLENPQIEIAEVESPDLDARIMAERIASTLEKFGSRRFKAVMHKMMDSAMKAGALGVEILLSGKVPSQRAKTWRVFQGYLKKCGYIAQHDVRISYAQALLKTGVVGIKVSIMPNIKLPDNISVLEEPITKIEEVVEEVKKVKNKSKSKSSKKTSDRKSRGKTTRSKKNTRSKNENKKTKSKDTEDKKVKLESKKETKKENSAESKKLAKKETEKDKTVDDSNKKDKEDKADEKADNE